MSPAVRELINVAVQLHVTAGGTDPDHMRALLEAITSLAESDGAMLMVSRIGAGIETDALIRRVTA